MDVWKDIRALNKGAAVLPNTTEGVSGPDNIAELWRQHDYDLFICVKGNPYNLGNIASGDIEGFTATEVHQAILQLAKKKASGPDPAAVEHLRFATPKAAILLAIFLTSLMSHGLLPDSLLSITLVPVMKDKADKVGSLDTYCPMALADVVSKVLQSILLGWLFKYTGTTDN